ncbi:hypothetical protein WME76_48360 (plasmid) [Sorangium sp. So ce119]|uniref:hypothetical protein n=1 Tax=Sorangium sp. So ce119 TaxID=3133279 RepID=UPI003F61F0D8
MKYIFNTQFLKVQPPATSFGDAWELLCLDLLRASDPDGDYLHLMPPDRGIDILHKSAAEAYQCKSDERGALGTIPAAPTVESLRTAVEHWNTFEWLQYRLATNAEYTGRGVEEILKVAEELGVGKRSILFLGPDYWSELCDQHLSKVQSRLDYRLFFTEEQTIDAFRKARYFEHKVKEYERLIKDKGYVLDLANNRTPVRLQIPFSLDLTVEHCLDVAMSLLGLTLRREEYADLRTSASPSISITIDRVSQDFSKKLAEYTDEERQKLSLWITIVWSDELSSDTKRSTREMHEFVTGLRDVNIDYVDRRAMTIRRFERSLEETMWTAVLGVPSVTMRGGA